VSIQKRGVIVINRAAHELLKRPDWVTLWCEDENHSKMIIASSTKGAEGATPARKQGNSSSRYVAGMAFTTWYRIDVTVARNFTPVLEDGDLRIDLTQGKQAIGLSHRKRQANGKAGTLQNALEGVKEALTQPATDEQGNGAKVSRKQLQQLRQILEQLEAEQE
jgi:hypothetical protein